MKKRADDWDEPTKPGRTESEWDEYYKQLQLYRDLREQAENENRLFPQWEEWYKENS